MRRVLLALAAAAAFPAGLIVALPTASAFASAAAPTIVTCTHLTGTATATTATGHATGCNHTAITGSSGTLTAPVAGTSFTIKWHTGKTTKGTSTMTVVTPSTCPSTFPTEVRSHNTVTGGTAKALIGGKTTTTICANATTGKFELHPGTTYKI